MKTIIFMLSVIFAFASGLECFGQKKQPLFGNGYHTPGNMKKLVSLKNDSKATQARNFFFYKTGENNLDSVFSKVCVVKDTTLEAGTYQNSQWNPVTKKIEFIPGKKFTGDVTVYKTYDEDGVYHKILLFKNKCGNVLDAEDESLVLREEDEPYVPEDYENSDLASVNTKKGTVYLVDTVHDTIVVIRNNTVYHRSYYYYGDGMNYVYYPYARPVFYSAWFSWGWYYYPSWRSFRERHHHHCHFHHEKNHNVVNFDNRYYGSRVTNTGHGDGGGQSNGGGRVTGSGHYKNTNGTGRGRVGGALNRVTTNNANVQGDNGINKGHGRIGGALNRATANNASVQKRDDGTSKERGRSSGVYQRTTASVQMDNGTRNGRNSNVQNDRQRSPRPVIKSERNVQQPHTRLTENSIQRSQPIQKGQLQRPQPSRKSSSNGDRSRN